MVSFLTSLSPLQSKSSLDFLRLRASDLEPASLFDDPSSTVQHLVDFLNLILVQQQEVQPSAKEALESLISFSIARASLSREILPSFDS